MLASVAVPVNALMGNLMSIVAEERAGFVTGNVTLPAVDRFPAVGTDHGYLHEDTPNPAACASQYQINT
jgi:hypothetical protein